MPPKGKETQLNVLFDELFPPPPKWMKIVGNAKRKDMDALIHGKLQACYEQNLHCMELVERTDRLHF
jgi:hypothetical protein